MKLSCSNHRPRSTSQRAQFLTLSLLLHRLQIAALTQLGMFYYQIATLYLQTKLIPNCSYQNGSILIATLLPQFTILHTLTTSRGPSAIISLAWHASSSKQKSNMLATQASDGDLRIWSVAKPPSKEAPRVIRVLKRSDSTSADPKWMAWSKNGKIVQYLEG